MSAPPDATVRLAPAKVNLGLAVTGRRPDRFHELRSVFLRVGLGDVLSGTIDDTLERDRLAVQGGGAGPLEENTVMRAVDLLRRGRPDLSLPTLDMQLEKRIPVSAGLGGGSSDAAATIFLAAHLWSMDLQSADADALAERLGADVPFFMGDPPVALVTGIGEKLEPLNAVDGDPGLLLVTPQDRLSTAAVFAEFDRQAAVAQGSADTVDALAAAFRSGLDAPALAGWAARLRDANDLWPAAARLLPSLEALRTDLERALDRPFLLSGSGSTLFALYASVGEAQEAAGRLSMPDFDGLAGAEIFATGIDSHQDAGRIQ